MIAIRRRLQLRLRREEGFGLVELLIAMSVLVVGILAVFLLFQAGIVQIRRASTVSTAAALAEAEIEFYRAIRFDSIGLAQADIDAIPGGDPYNTDSAYNAGALVILAKCGSPPCTSKDPIQASVTGADGKQYRIDTFMSWQTVTGGRDVKVLTIVVRDMNDLTKEWARVVSSFDESTGL